MIYYNNNIINKLYRHGGLVNKIDKVVGGAMRLPSGYTEVDYIENTSSAYINTLFKPNQDTRIIAEMQCVTSTNSALHFGAGGWDRTNGMWLTYEKGISGTLHIAWLGKTTWTTFSNIHGDYNKHIYDWNKNELYKDGVFVGSSTYGTYQCVNNLAIFAQLQGNVEVVGGIYLKGRMFSFKIYDNDTLIRDFVPCIRNNDSVAGAYDIVNGQFYSSANNGYSFVAGPTSTNPSTSKTIFQYVECATPSPTCAPPSSATTYTVDEQFDFTKPVYELDFGDMANLSEHEDPYDSASVTLYDENNTAYSVGCIYTSSNGSWSIIITQNGTTVYTSNTSSFSCCTVFGKPMYLHSDEIPTIQTCNMYECLEYECLEWDEESGECLEYGDCVEGQEMCVEAIDNYVLSVQA